MYNKNFLINKMKYILHILGLLSIKCLYSLNVLLKYIIELCIVVAFSKKGLQFLFSDF